MTMRRRGALVAGVFLCGLLGQLLPVVAWAGLFAPEGHRGTIEEKSQNALVFFDGQRQELILSTSYKVTDGQAPKALAWVIPLPSAPEQHALESSRIFSQLAEAMKPPIRRRDRRSKVNQTPRKNVQVKALGDYQVQLFKEHGPAAVRSLQAWFSQQGFRVPSRTLLDHYAAGNATFIVVRVDPSTGLSRLPESGTFRPIRISFRSSVLTYPVKGTEQAGRFDLSLYTVTPDMVYIPQGRPQDRHHSEFDLFRKRIRPMRLGPKDHFGSSAVRTLWQKLIAEEKIDFRYALVTRFVGKHLNRPSKPVAGWPRDIELHLVYRQWLPFGFD